MKMLVQRLSTKRGKVKGDRLRSLLGFPQKIMTGEVVLAQRHELFVRRSWFVQEYLGMYVVAQLLDSNLVESGRGRN
jgi:hypothetical protein